MTNKKITFTTDEALKYLKENNFSYTKQSLHALNKRNNGILCKKVTERKFLWYKEELDKLLP